MLPVVRGIPHVEGRFAQRTQCPDDVVLFDWRQSDYQQACGDVIQSY